MQISPSNTYVGLTSDAPGSEPGEPNKYYPTGKRTFARVVPIDTVQAAAVLIELKSAGCTSFTVWNSKTTYSAGLAENLKLTAPKAGVKMDANVGYDPKAANYRSLAGNINSPCFVMTGEVESNANQALKDVGAAKPDVKLYATDGDCLNASADPTKGVPPAIASRFKCTIATLDPESFGAEGKKFFSDFSKKFDEPSPDPYAIYGYETMKLMLDAIKTASANGTKAISREDVVNEVFKTKNRDSVLGTYTINKDGDSDITDYGLYRIEGGTLTFEKVLKTESLLGGSAASG
jgi:branched-chain amino acid transport system substrate-binding protein